MAPGGDPGPARHDGGAHGHGLGAARMERAARRRGQGAWRVTRQTDRRAPARRVGHGHGQQQGPGVGVQRVGEQLWRRSQLHEPSQVHHGHAVGDMPDHGQVVGNEHIGQAEVALQLAQQVDDLGLDGHVKGGHGLVADHAVRVQGQGAGNGHALALAPGKLVGVAPGQLGPQAHALHKLRQPRRARRPGHAMDGQGLDDGRPDGPARVQGGERILKDHLHLARIGRQERRRGASQVLPVHHDASRAGALQAQEQPCQGGLAATRLAHQPQGLAPGHVQSHAVHSADHGPLRAEQAAAHGVVPGDIDALDEGVYGALLKQGPPRIHHARPRGKGLAPGGAWR